MAIEKQVAEHIEKVQVGELLTRYFAAVDDKQLDENIVEATFSKDAKIVRPDGASVVGCGNILEGHAKSFARFKATHHVITNYLIDISGDNATLRANVIANHVWGGNDSDPSLDGKYFLADGVFSAEAIKTNNSWRISKLTNRVVWRTGDGMTEMLKP